MIQSACWTQGQSGSATHGSATLSLVVAAAFVAGLRRRSQGARFHGLQYG